MIQSKEDYLYYLVADRIALGEKRSKPHLISIWEADVFGNFRDCSEKRSICITASHQEYTSFIISGFNIVFSGHRLRQGWVFL